MQDIKKSPLQFNLSAIFATITAAALYLAALTAFGRSIGLSHEETLALGVLNKGFGLPLLLVWLVGGVVVLNRWSRHPAVSRSALIGLGGFALIACADAFLDVWVFSLARPGTGMTSEYLWIIYVARVVESILNAVCLSLLVIAVLMCRGTNSASVDRWRDS